MKTLKKIVFYIAAIGMMASFLLLLSSVGAHGNDMITTRQLFTHCLACFGFGFGSLMVCGYTAESEEVGDNGA